jgi:two-component system, NarL family, nitrate/nitrite response regulator NarL
MSQHTRLMIVHHNRLFRECLASALDKLGGITIVNGGNCDRSVSENVSRHQPDVVLVGLDLPNEAAPEMTKQIAQECCETRVLILGITEGDPRILTCIENGAKGYVAKEASLEDLRTTIQLVMRGEAVCSPQVATSMFSRLAELARKRSRVDALSSLNLTFRELEVLRLVAQGLSNRQIADRLFVSLYTVKNHVHNILEKLRVQRRVDAVEIAYERNWLKRVRRQPASQCVTSAEDGETSRQDSDNREDPWATSASTTRRRRS